MLSTRTCSFLLQPICYSAMVHVGAKGEAETPMRDPLQFRILQVELQPIVKRINLDLTSLTDDGATEGFELRVANSMWAQGGYPCWPTFLTTLAENYGQDESSMSTITRKESKG
ncbi:MAG: hypothetical protein GY818_17420 [Planctomycetaceae bacterium]|nr:hypothetical protein [Planctomycetaceae bacterium]